MQAESTRRITLGQTNSMGDLAHVLPRIVFPFRLNRGSNASALESCFARTLGAGRAHAFFAGRVALAAILDALQIGAGDEVIIPAFTCVAVPNPVIARRARPVYADISPKTGNLDPGSVEKCITPRTRAILVQHTFGIPCDIDPLQALANRHSLKVIEDCTHALGSRLHGKPVGTFGDAAFFSFEQSKIASAGTGGITYTEDTTVAARIAEYQAGCRYPAWLTTWRMLWYLVDLILLSGPTRLRFDRTFSYYLARIGLARGPITSASEMVCDTPDDVLVTRYPNALAKIALAQMQRLQSNIRRRRHIAEQYGQMFRDLSLGTLEEPLGAQSNFLRFPIVVDDKPAFMAFMKERGVQAGDWFSAPVHPVGVDQGRAGYRDGSCPNAEWAVRHIANLPINTRMNDDDICRVLMALKEYASLAGGHTLRSIPDLAERAAGATVVS